MSLSSTTQRIVTRTREQTPCGISIVMAYYNRKSLLQFTLQTITQSAYKDVELIIVDDGSAPEHRLEDIIGNYDLNIVLVRIEKEHKQHINPCIPYNIGFSYISGKIVILQNPEVCHIGDVLSYIAANLTEDQHISLTCANFDTPNHNEDLYRIYKSPNDINEVKSFIESLTRIPRYQAWYNHPVHCPKSYHFLAAMYKTKLDQLGGFDERYAHGSSYDDNEILERSRLICEVKCLDWNDVFCIHQWHAKTNHLVNHSLAKINEKLYIEHMKSLGIRVTL